MERLGIIEDLIEVGREEAPRILAERSREAIETVEAGVAAALASAQDRLRPEPRRPSAVRLLLLGLITAAAMAVIGFLVAKAVERGQRWLRDRERRGRFDPLVVEAERASEQLEAEPGESTLAKSPIAIPVDTETADVGVDAEDEVRATA